MAGSGRRGWTTTRERRRGILRFDGVLFGYEVWLNGKYVGRWGSAYNLAQWDVKLGWRRSRRLNPGEEPTFEPGAWAGLEYDAVQDISYDGIMRCRAEAKELLGAFPIDLVSVHDPDEYLYHAEEQRDRERRDQNALSDLSLSAPLRDIKEAYEALFELKARGEAESVGIGSKDWCVIEMLWRDGVKFDWAMFACQPTLLVHPPELISFVNELRAAGLTLIDSAVFNGGFLIGSDMLDYRKDLLRNLSR